jgi:hypothetical protein
MKGKYITTQIIQACLTAKAEAKKDIHTQIKETLAEREKVFEQMRRQSRLAKVVDMYLEEYMVA